MKKAIMSLRVLMMICLALGLAGRSGGAAINVVSSASGQVTAATYVQQWSQILWGTVSDQTGTQTPTSTVPEYDPDDNTLTWTSTAADGTKATITFYLLDGSYRIRFVLPNGTTQTLTQSAPVFTNGGLPWTADWTLTSSDGLNVRYTSTVDDPNGTWWDGSDDTTDLVGSATLPKGIKQTFQVHTGEGHTIVQSKQSDGSTFTLDAPLDLKNNPELQQPDYKQDATGAYVSPAFNIAFTLTHPKAEKRPTRWSAMLSSPGPQVRGEFLLYKDFSGYGQLMQTLSGGRRKLLAVLSWKQNGESQVYPLSGRRSQTRPAGAAQDFLRHRWQTLTAKMGPAPGL